MNRRELLKFAGSAAAATALPAAAAPPATSGKARRKQPNLLFLLTDQLRHDTLATYGNKQIKVPNLNRLASESVVFQNYYCTQPICTPSRGSLLTGLWPHTHGEYTNNIPLAKNIPVLVEMLRPNQYETAYFGKWHLGNEIQIQHGFDEFESIEDLYSGHHPKTGLGVDGKPLRQHSGYYDFLKAHGIKPDARGEYSREYSNSLPEELSKPAYLAGLAEGFLDQDHHKPWVMYVSFLDPHTPFNSAFDKMYNPDDMHVPASFDEPVGPTELTHNRDIRTALENDKKGNPMKSGAALRQTIAHYWGKVSLVDTMVGRILDKLAATHQEEDTIIVFTTDHGEMMGDHHLMYKSVMYQQATRVPMILKVPGLHAHPGVENPVSAIDVVPTLLDLLGEPLQPHLQGDSWAAYLKEGRQPPEKSVMIEWNGPPWPFKSGHLQPLRTIRSIDGWKLTLAEGSEGELFNLNDDPSEMKNLFYDDASLERIKKLAAEMNLWQKSTGDNLLVFDPAQWSARKAAFAQPSAPG